MTVFLRTDCGFVFGKKDRWFQRQQLLPQSSLQLWAHGELVHGIREGDARGFVSGDEMVQQFRSNHSFLPFFHLPLRLLRKARRRSLNVEPSRELLVNHGPCPSPIITSFITTVPAAQVRLRSLTHLHTAPLHQVAFPLLHTHPLKRPELPQPSPPILLVPQKIRALP